MTAAAASVREAVVLIHEFEDAVLDLRSGQGGDGARVRRDAALDALLVAMSVDALHGTRA